MQAYGQMEIKRKENSELLSARMDLGNSAVQELKEHLMPHVVADEADPWFSALITGLAALGGINLRRGEGLHLGEVLTPILRHHCKHHLLHVRK